MARREVFYTVADEGRDKGKVFKITEAPASEIEAWIVQLAALAAQKGHGSMAQAMDGIAGFVMLGIQGILGGVGYDDLEPLLAQMLKTVMFVPDGRHELARALIDEDDIIEEWLTRFRLREEVLRLNLGFSLADALSILRTPAQSTTPTPVSSETTSTSRLQ